MAKAKYKEYVEKMMAKNKQLFVNFENIHFKYSGDPEKYQKKFNEEGKIIMEVVRDWENKLCGSSERGGYGSFSPKLAEKFHAEIKKLYPMIDHIGIIVNTPPRFTLKKIKLN